MYRRPKFLEELLEIREQMARDAFYDADLFAEQVRTGKRVRKITRSGTDTKPAAAKKKKSSDPDR